MVTRIAAIMVCLSLLAFPTVGAYAKKQVNQQVDMAKYTCKDLAAEEGDDAGMVLIWLDGYVSGKTGDTTIDMKFLSDLGEAVGKECGENPKAKVLEIVQRVTQQ